MTGYTASLSSDIKLFVQLKKGLFMNDPLFSIGQIPIEVLF